MKAVRRVNSKTSHHKEKVFSISLIVYLCEMMDVHYIYCGNYFMMYVSQIIMWHTLNLYSVVCQLFLNETGRKKRIIVRP